jgi:hypothetical protein
LPLRWQARFEDVTPTSFVDRMVRGPMRTWRHRHSFVAVDDHTTDVVDEVEVQPRLHPLWGPVGVGMAFNLPVLFAFRQWQTRRLLAQHRESGLALTAVLQSAGQRQRGLTKALAAATLALGAVAGLSLARRAQQPRQPQPFSRNGTA